MECDYIAFQQYIAARNYRKSTLSSSEDISLRDFPFNWKVGGDPELITHERIREKEGKLGRASNMRPIYRHFLASILTASGLGLALYGTYGDRTLGAYVSIPGTMIFIGGLLLLTLWQLRPGTTSPSHR